MAEETILQNWIFKELLLPFLLVFFIIFAVLEKTKVFGEGKKQINALVSFVIGLIFVGVVYPTRVISNITLFLTVAIVIVFVVLLLWGFIFSDKEGFKLTKWMKVTLGIVVSVALVGGIIWATGWDVGIKNLFSGGTSQTIIVNATFIIVIAVALAVILIGEKKKSG